MNKRIRQKLIEYLTSQAGITETPLTYKHCAQIALILDCDANSMARLFALPAFKPTQILKPDLEQKIATYLGYKNYEALEEVLMHEIVTDSFLAYCTQRRQEAQK
jgi:hypothetical protein